jgi:hypothetical protein
MCLHHTLVKSLGSSMCNWSPQTCIHPSENILVGADDSLEIVILSHYMADPSCPTNIVTYGSPCCYHSQMEPIIIRNCKPNGRRYPLAL